MDIKYYRVTSLDNLILPCNKRVVIPAFTNSISYTAVLKEYAEEVVAGITNVN
jgi:hypothetical protein